MTWYWWLLIAWVVSYLVAAPMVIFGDESLSLRTAVFLLIGGPFVVLYALAYGIIKYGETIILWERKK